MIKVEVVAKEVLWFTKLGVRDDQNENNLLTKARFIHIINA
jgi:hypothetical protein